MEMSIVDAYELLDIKEKWERIARGDALESDLVDVPAQMWYMMEFVLKGKRRRKR
ncbi:hypothetical protein KAT51_08505 [bacterium]|nr:hypothetical protein [bacterium]